ncbi:hypothetical protein [Endozoicomonas sp. 4G]|uniref:hypothetical protein n=1 Tax=Endozoicomonas sp. 4G TaxID=2872754 RepID=UPI0020790E98|nr:hypothetical protein [Endozoicomonas sp. 4G]
MVFHGFNRPSIHIVVDLGTVGSSGNTTTVMVVITLCHYRSDRSGIKVITDPSTLDTSGNTASKGV